MLRFLIPLSIIVCIVALPHEVREKRAEKSDQISYPKENEENAAAVVVAEKAPATGNGTEVDSRFLGVGIGLGLAVGQKLLGGGHHQHHHNHYDRGYGGKKF